MRRTASARRRTTVDDAVAPALDVVVATLRSGGSVRDGLEAASVDGPLGSELRSVLARALHHPLRDVLTDWGRGHRSPSVRLAAAAMAIALDTGGEQAPALEAVAKRVRDRAALAREIRSASASARISAVVIACTPIVFAAVVALVDPAVVAAALGSRLGQLCIVAGIACQIAGIAWMRRLVDERSLLQSYGRDGVAEVADLLALTLGSGLTVPAAIDATAPHLSGTTGRLLRVTTARLAAGRRFGDELAAWIDVGAMGIDARPLVSALVAAHQDGAPAAAAVERLAVDLRHAQRQAVNERVQRLPVLLLFPLVTCVLPAFVLLAVMPIALGSVLAMRGG